MLQKNLLNIFFTKISIKTSTLLNILSSHTESNNIVIFSSYIKKNLFFEHYFFSIFLEVKQKREVANCVFKDMLKMVSMWRQLRGYPSGGNTTHTNANTSKKNKLLFNYRLAQYYNMFGQRKRDVYPTLIKAEYTNRLWFLTWTLEYANAALFALNMAELGLKAGCFNPVLLAQHHVNGFPRIGNAAKLSKAKRLSKVYTLGVPLLFAKYIFPQKTPIGFPRIILKDEVNKFLGKKLRRKDR